MWRKSLHATPLTNLGSDRICAIRLSLTSSLQRTSMHIICAYLPSSDHTFEEYCKYVGDLVSIISTLEPYGPLILVGDLNAHLNDPTNKQGDLVLEAIRNFNLFIASSSCIAKGPGYTFFNTYRKTVVDYILISTSISHSITECHTHDHHDLNFPDHLPFSVLLKAESLSSPALKGNLKVNWRKSVDDGLIADYAHNVCQDVRPLLSHHFQSVSKLNKEIRLVSKTLIEAASKHLSSTHHRKIKSFIRDTELSTLRKQSRKAWERWRSAGRPRDGTLYVDKRDSKKKVRQYVAMCRAREERAKIQARDTLFSENSRNRFKSSNPRIECKGLRINENICTSPQEIAGRFRDYYKELATSSQSSTLIEALKLGKSGGIDSLDPEHICFGGETLRLWLKKIFNRVIALEQIPTTLNEGLIIPVHKGKGKDPFKPESYRGITLSSVISKLFEIILLRRLSLILEEVGVPDFAQTAYLKCISCADAIFATQEALLTHVHDGGKPFLCLYDIEKSFDSVELPILLKQLFSIGINGKLWRLLKHWYSTSSAKVKVNGHISSSSTSVEASDKDLCCRPPFFSQ